MIFGDSFWVDQVAPLDLDHSGKTILVTDARFPNEIERIRALGGTMVRTHGPVADNGDEHPSEQRIDDALIDFEVDNSNRSDNFASLDRQVVGVFSQVKPAPPVEEPRVVQRGTRHVDAILRMEDKTDDE